jgi:predicted MFS family arabinose efflux permease
MESSPFVPALPWVAPFAIFLLAIAVLPLLAPHFWESNLRKLGVAAVLGLPVLGLYLVHEPGALVHAGADYASFLVLLGSLFVISGGVMLDGDLQATPRVNTVFLALGSLFASFVGTTGASMLLIRPLLRTNSERRHVVHTVVFFIFLVSNIGGCLTPLGDPPLFLGYLIGVPFAWTLRLFVPWLFTVAVIAVIWIFAYHRLPAIAWTVAIGAVNIAVVLGSLFVLASAETFADVASGSLLPRIVPREHLGTANARLQGAFLLTNQLLAPPIGAFLFVVGMALPFAADAASFALGALLVTRVVTSRAGDAAGAKEEAPAPARTSLRGEMVDGLRWLLAHAPMRTLALTIVAFNVTFGAAFGVLVLYARDRLGMDAVGFGLLTTATAIGGLLGTAAYGRLERRFALGDIMRAGLLIETATHLVLALTTVPAIAMVTMVAFGAHGFIWATTATTIRQRAVPDALLGRITGVYTVGIYGGIVVGTPIGGLLARQLGITAPFWFAFVGSALLVLVMWRQFSHIAHDD